MKFPEGGGFFYASLFVEEASSSRGPQDSKTEDWPEVKKAAPSVNFSGAA
jgi:hypothetical protein